MPQYPAACQNVVAVSATDSYDVVTTFSTYGSNISLSAPGSGIWTTNRDGNSQHLVRNVIRQSDRCWRGWVGCHTQSAIKQRSHPSIS